MREVRALRFGSGGESEILRGARPIGGVLDSRGISAEMRSAVIVASPLGPKSLLVLPLVFLAGAVVVCGVGLALALGFAAALAPLGVVVTGLALALALFVLPTVVAFSRRAENTLAIFLLNVFLGWTVVAWIVLLVWALVARPRTTS